MEVLGVVAASAQLFGTAIGIVEAIVQLRDYLQHASNRLKGWQAELVVLDATISCIRQNPKLHTANVERILEAVAQKVEELCHLFAQSSIAPNLKFVKKLLKSLSARTVEPRILQSFTALERDKATLLLAINTIYTSILNEFFNRTGQNMQSTKTFSFANFPREFLSRADQQQLLQIAKLLHQHGDGYLPSLDRPPQRLLRSLQMSPSEADLESRDGLRSQRSTFKGIKLKGNDCLFGDTTGRGGSFEDIEIEGMRRVDGTHTADAAAIWRQSFARQNGDGGGPGDRDAHSAGPTNDPTEKGGSFEDIEIEGMRRVDGTHTAETAVAWCQSFARQNGDGGGAGDDQDAHSAGPTNDPEPMEIDS